MSASCPELTKEVSKRMGICQDRLKGYTDNILSKSTSERGTSTSSCLFAAHTPDPPSHTGLLLKLFNFWYSYVSTIHSNHLYTLMLKYVESTKLPKDCIVCTLNVSSLYTNILTGDGIHAVLQAIESSILTEKNLSPTHWKRYIDDIF